MTPVTRKKLQRWAWGFPWERGWPRQVGEGNPRSLCKTRPFLRCGNPKRESKRSEFLKWDRRISSGPGHRGSALPVPACNQQGVREVLERIIEDRQQGDLDSALRRRPHGEGSALLRRSPSNSCRHFIPHRKPKSERRGHPKEGAGPPRERRLWPSSATALRYLAAAPLGVRRIGESRAYTTGERNSVAGGKR